MKNYAIIGLVLISASAFAQKIDQSKVPAPAKAAFAKSFPAATGVKWELENKNYEAGFKENGKHISAVYDAKGTWMETETAIAVTALPKAAAEYVASHYKGAKIKETAEIKKANGDINYEAEVNGKDVIFDSKGNFLKEQKG
ncbi:putative PepSY-like beta-lactamase-inhibitor [Chitinophaga niastensis]|uniref:Putative PepSY-like beta-lactamase-inhibitor n=1 Tax=Chitinophaga niastensis TaxID=536980 RepID=A0A2P8HNW4_CHINA|nr:PepSY-like domain-containing protein [Chitinophaga niastensis]PSL47910.1 putative PepSY-like beta-lactamase-inhibitor [Chitinophaga niastensis]